MGLNRLMMSSVYEAARCGLSAVAHVASKIPATNRKYLVQNRLAGPWIENPDGKNHLWMHGASLGECKMLIGLAKALREDYPEIPSILLTTQKAEIVETLAAAGEGVCHVAIAPADTRASLKKFMRQVNPAALILGENELWPGYLAAMKSFCGRPAVALVSGRFSGAVSCVDLSALGYACMQTPTDLALLKSFADVCGCPLPTCGADGDPKERCSALTNGSEADPKERCCLTVGGNWKLLPWARSAEDVRPHENPVVDVAFLSFHEEELSAFLQMAANAVSRKESVVLVPRRLEEVPTFLSALQSRSIQTVVWPEVQEGSVSVVNRFGVVRDVLNRSRSAVVGGSFSSKLGVHDFWEPLCFGVSTFVGPFSNGAADAVNGLVGRGALTKFSSADEFGSKPLPERSLVFSALQEERQKILDSYDQLQKFLKDLLQ